MIEIAFAEPARQVLLELTVPISCTIDGAIRRSGILSQCPQIDLSVMSVGIWGERRRLTDLVREGDRVEIYRSLLMDPKEARRVRMGSN